MAPLTPSWAQPSHPDIQDVVLPTDPSQFTTKSLSKVDLPPYAVFAKMAFPPCTKADAPTYATVQMGKSEHLNLNSDLVYINHSCDPSLRQIFDMSSLNIIVGDRGLKAGEELTFFYPSTEWSMDQGFDCLCGSKKCLGYISGAKHMTASQLEGRYLNAHIQQLLESQTTTTNLTLTNGKAHTKTQDPTEAALTASLAQARRMVDAAQKALDVYVSIHSEREVSSRHGSAVGSRELGGEMGGDTRRGVTSREMSGEMGGDTVVV
ncbi:histone H3-K36 methyltransferase [Hyphodiscus hymeniophilus]|uniref:Histone H3-K36 methyltransferase n=1 Tax=Hyphodiscus hymeniophilus TaxID=353542 RepID=A0A9P6VE50_9HELO|nr:histone H3-K36 methyltransferase [Hyphodiscus hymeniophilus]